MSQKNKERVHLIYGIVLSVLIAVLGVCLIVSCITIYKSGDHPFTPESISAQFKKIIVPTVACLVGIVGGMIVSIALPLENKKLRPSPDQRALICKMRKKLAAKGSLSETADKIEGNRDILRTLSLSLCGVSAVPVFLYIFNESSFTDEINQSMISLMYILLPCAVFAFAVGIFYSFYEKASLKKEAEELKNALAVSSDSGVAIKPVSVATEKTSVITIVRVGVFAVAVIFIVAGIYNGGMSDVLEKAIKICTECIGLG